MMYLHCGSELENEKMIGAGLKPEMKDHITPGLWLAPEVSWRPLITAGSNQEPGTITVGSSQEPMVIK